MKKVALLCAVALCLAACHCERKTTGTPCRKAACKCKHAQVKKDCKCHQVHMGPLQQACSCTTSCVAPKAKPVPGRHMDKPILPPQHKAARPTAEQKAAEQTAALSTLGTVKAKDNKISLTYKEPIHFATNSEAIETSSYKELDATANVLKKYPDTKITVHGYTDSIGHPAYNVDLSQRRAQAVANALTKRGVNAQNVTAIGHGAANPIATNKTAEGRRLNRRVELEIENN